MLGTAVDVLGFLCVVTLPLHAIGEFAFSRLVLRTPTVARRLFGFSFAMSVALLLLVPLEVAGTLAAPTRWVLWRLHLLLDIALLVLCLPYVVLVLVLRRTLSPHGLTPGGAKRLAVAPLVGWLWLFYKLGEPFPTLTSDELTRNLWVVPGLCISRAGVIGVCVTAVLSGSGAVSGPATSLRRLITPVDSEEMDACKREPPPLLPMPVAPPHAPPPPPRAQARSCKPSS